MKLSAPPPPPPEPPEPGPQPTPEPTPGSDSLAQTPTASGGEATASPAAKPATWPAWFGGVDVALVGLALALGFLVASFAARNTDVWLHLGAGRMLAAGEYKLGSDPMSYTAADRPWVNHSWLYDLGMYLLYRGDGALLVVIKAVAVAAAVALLIAVRRPGYALWPWAVLAALVVLAAAPRLTLSPLVGSVLFLALTLFLVFRVPSPPGSWRLPVAVGLTFWVWANVDAWFFIGPAALALLLIGELARKRFMNGGAPTPEAEDPLGRLPDTATLTRALLVGVVACMLNPHHVRVWELPFELVGGTALLGGVKGVDADPRLRAVLVSPLQGSFWQYSSWGNNANGFCYAILLLAGLYCTFLSGAVGRFVGPPADFDPLPLPHTLLWLGFVALSLLTVFAIPFLAVVTLPLVASRLNLMSERTRLGSQAERRTRLILTASGAGRVLSVVGLLALCGIAWAGWLHSPASAWWEGGPVNPAFTRPVTWQVEPDPALKRAAEWFATTRAEKRLPDDLRGLIASIELANYCAWYAPQEKVFVNGRLNHHRPELPDYLETRRTLGLIFANEEVPTPRDVAKVLERRNAGYVAISTSAGDNDRLRVPVQEISRYMTRDWSNWSPWYLDGRTTVAGWRPAPGRGLPEFDRLRIDPVRLAFGPGVERLPPANVTPIPPQRTSLDDFIRPARPASPHVDETVRWLEYRQVLGQRQATKTRLLQANLARLFPRFPVRPLPQDFVGLGIDKSLQTDADISAPWPAEGAVRATSVLALRAARRAIADNPDHPDGYFALANVLESGDLQLSEGERSVGTMTAYLQCLSRMPPPEAFRPGMYAASPYRVALALGSRYLGQQALAGDFTGARVDSGVIGLDLAGMDVLYVLPGNPNTRNRPFLARLPRDPGLLRQLPPGSQPRPGQYLLAIDLARKEISRALQYARVELSSAEEQRDEILKGLENMRKQLDTLVEQRFNQLREVTDKPQTKLRDRFFMAMRANLVGEAIDTIKGVREGLDKEFGQNTLDVIFQMIALELAVGRLEDAAADLAAVREELDKDAARTDVDRGRTEEARRRLRGLEFHKSVFEGNYAEAGSEFEQIVGPDVGKFPPEADLTRPDNAGFNPADFDPRGIQIFGTGWPMMGMLASTDTPLGLVTRNQAALVQIYRVRLFSEVIGRMQGDSEFFFRRGFFSLLEGDIAGARQRFRQATVAAPPGWKIPPYTTPLAGEYQRLIELGEKAPAP